MKSGMKERTGGGVRSAGCAAVPAMPSGSGSAAAGDAPWGCGRRARVGQSRPWGGLGAAVGSVGLGPGGCARLCRRRDAPWQAGRNACITFCLMQPAFSCSSFGFFGFPLADVASVS